MDCAGYTPIPVECFKALARADVIGYVTFEPFGSALKTLAEFMEESFLVMMRAGRKDRDLPRTLLSEPAYTDASESSQAACDHMPALVREYTGGRWCYLEFCED